MMRKKVATNTDKKGVATDDAARLARVARREAKRVAKRDASEIVSGVSGDARRQHVRAVRGRIPKRSQTLLLAMTSVNVDSNINPDSVSTKGTGANVYQ